MSESWAHDVAGRTLAYCVQGPRFHSEHSKQQDKQEEKKIKLFKMCKSPGSVEHFTSSYTQEAEVDLFDFWAS